MMTRVGCTAGMLLLLLASGCALPDAVPEDQAEDGLPASPAPSPAPTPPPEPRFLEGTLWDFSDRQDGCDPQPGATRNHWVTPLPLADGPERAMADAIIAAMGDTPSQSPATRWGSGFVGWTYYGANGTAHIDQPRHEGRLLIYEGRGSMPNETQLRMAAQRLGFDVEAMAYRVDADVAWMEFILPGNSSLGLRAYPRMRAGDQVVTARATMAGLEVPVGAAFFPADRAVAVALEFEECWQAAHAPQDGSAYRVVRLHAGSPTWTFWNDTLAYQVPFEYDRPAPMQCDGWNVPVLVDASSGRILGHAWSCFRLHEGNHLDDSIIRRPTPTWLLDEMEERD